MHLQNNDRIFLFSAAVSAWEGGTTPFALAAVPGGKALLDSLYVKRRFPDAAWVPKPPRPALDRGKTA